MRNVKKIIVVALILGSVLNCSNGKDNKDNLKLLAGLFLYNYITQSSKPATPGGCGFSLAITNTTTTYTASLFTPTTTLTPVVFPSVPEQVQAVIYKADFAAGQKLNITSTTTNLTNVGFSKQGDASCPVSGSSTATISSTYVNGTTLTTNQATLTAFIAGRYTLVIYTLSNTPTTGRTDLQIQLQ